MAIARAGPRGRGERIILDNLLERWWVVLAGGLVVGGLVHRAVDRLRFQKSFFWPIRNYCATCYQPTSLAASIPVFGWFFVLGRCGHCHAWLPFRRVAIEAITAALIVALYLVYLGHGAAWSFPYYPLGFDEEKLWALFVYHGLLMALLVAATFIDLDMMIIPDSVTVPGMILGIGLGTFWFVELHPVPLWSPPYHAGGLVLITEDRWHAWLGGLAEGPEWLRGLAESPSWWPDVVGTINEHWRMNWNRWLGFSTGLVGLLVGGGVVWIVRAVCGWIFGREALGFGDVTLMAMVGAFLGWQTAVLAFFLAPLSAVGVGVLGWVFTGKSEIPYGPHLSLATAFCVLAWRELWARVAPLFFDFSFFLLAAFVLLVLLVLVASAVQFTKRLILRFLNRGRWSEGGQRT